MLSDKGNVRVYVSVPRPWRLDLPSIESSSQRTVDGYEKEIDMSLATEHRASQGKSNIGHPLDSNLVGTTRFASVNDRWGVGE